MMYYPIKIIHWKKKYFLKNREPKSKKKKKKKCKRTERSEE